MFRSVPLGARLAVVVSVASLGGGCSSGSGPGTPLAWSTLEALDALSGGPTLTAVVDDRAVATNLTFGQLTNGFTLSPGQHTVVMEPADTTHRLLLVFSTVGNIDYQAFVIDSLSGSTVIIDPVLMPDTGAVPASGHGRLRVANFAQAAPAIDVYRSEPDSTGLVATARPLNFRAVTPYWDGPSGTWAVVVSHSGMHDTLLATGPIALAAGEAETVALLDSVGGRVTWRPVPHRH
jgi:uncharacterized protein DUF4397